MKNSFKTVFSESTHSSFRHSLARTTAVLLGTLTFAMSCADDTDDEVTKPLELISQGNVLRIDQLSNELSVTRNDENLLSLPLTSLAVGIVDRADEMLSYDPYWYTAEAGVLRVDPPNDLRYRGIESWKVESASDSQLVLDVTWASSVTGKLRIVTTSDGFALDMEPVSVAPDIVLMRVEMNSDSKEGFYGLGEWPDQVNHRGKLRPMQIEADLVIESANNENHAPIPLLIGSTGWGFFVESTRVGLFDVATEDPRKTTVTFAGDSLRFHIFAEDHPLDITKHYFGVTGAPKLPAPWALGPFIWRDENKDQAQVEEDIEFIRDLDLATSAIWIDRPYATAVNTFDFLPEDYPNPQAMIDKAHDFGLRIGVWHTPYLATDTGDLLKEAQEKKFFPPVDGTLLNKWGIPIDYTNPEAYAWWQMQLKKYTDMGIEGFKLDYAEDIVAGISGGRTIWVFADGSDERTMHHGYTNLYHKVYAEMLPEDGGFLLCRAARWGDQVNGPIMWPGDLDANFARFGETKMDRNGDSYTAVGGIPASLSMSLGLGPSGFPFYGADTGGYRHSPPDNETFIRWFQQTAFSVVMQVGDSSSQTPWEYNEENGRNEDTLNSYREFARIHLRLFPYLWTYAKQVPITGRAIQRALGIAHPELGVHPSDTFLLGDNILVAPIIERGVMNPGETIPGPVTRTVNFPAGDWIHWFTGVRYSKPEASVTAGLFELPAFIKAGGIVPMLRPTIDTLSPTTIPDRVDSFATTSGPLYLRLFPGPASEFTIYDGTKIQQELSDKELTVSLSEGDVFTNGYVIEILGVEEDPSSVEIDGAQAMSWTRTSSAPFVLEVSAPKGAKEVVVQLP